MDYTVLAMKKVLGFQENHFLMSTETFPGIINDGIQLGLHYCPGKCADVVTDKNK